jgi:hypothetical protein
MIMRKITLKLFTIKIMLLFAFTLVACSSNKTYKITFDTQTNVLIEPIVAKPGDAIFAPRNPIRDNHEFFGWLYNGEPFNFGVMPSEDVHLVADWRQYYTISFDTDGGNSLEAIQIIEGEDISIPNTPRKPNHKFVGWSLEGNSFVNQKMPSSNLVLKAQWVPASTITFVAAVYDRHLNEYVEIYVEDLVEVAGEKITSPNSPTYPEYYFLNWQLDGVDYYFDIMPDEDITLTAIWRELSNLPALFIDLYDETGEVYLLDSVNRQVYVNSKISLVNTSEAFTIDNVDAEFRGRGNGSWVDSGDKRGYRIKFEDAQSVLGAPVSRHWVILANANFDDITMFRNKLAYTMANEIFTHIDYATSTQWVDVYVNGEYRGVYLIAEHVRVDENRVNIQSEFGVEDTGFLIEYDSYASGVEGIDYFRVSGVRYPFSVKSPKPDDYLEAGLTEAEYRQQVSEIQAMVQTMVTAIMEKDFETFTEYADLDSFVDIYLLQELFKNIDAGFSSFFMYRHPGGKIHLGPPWDFDATLGSSPARGNGSPTGIYVGLSVQAFSSRTANEMLISLYATPEFRSEVNKRWQELSPDIQTFVDETLSDEMVETYRYAIGRNFVRWPTPQGYGPAIEQETAEDNWVNNIATLKTWLTNRINWLTNEWQVVD